MLWSYLQDSRLSRQHPWNLWWQPGGGILKRRLFVKQFFVTLVMPVSPAEILCRWPRIFVASNFGQWQSLTSLCHTLLTTKVQVAAWSWSLHLITMGNCHGKSHWYGSVPVVVGSIFKSQGVQYIRQQQKITDDTLPLGTSCYELNRKSSRNFFVRWARYVSIYNTSIFSELTALRAGIRALYSCMADCSEQLVTYKRLKVLFGDAFTSMKPGYFKTAEYIKAGRLFHMPW